MRRLVVLNSNKNLIPKMKYSIFIFFILFLLQSCQKDIPSGKQFITQDQTIHSSQLYKGVRTKLNPDFHLLDTSEIKVFKYDITYFSEQDSTEYIWAKATILMDIAKLEIDGESNWLPFRASAKSWIENEDAILYLKPTIVSMETDINDFLTTWMHVESSLAKKGKRNETIRNGNETRIIMEGPSTSIADHLDLINGNHEFKIQNQSPKKDQDTIVTIVTEDRLSQSIYEQLFYTRVEIKRRQISILE